jgi:chorismate lyase
VSVWNSDWRSLSCSPQVAAWLADTGSMTRKLEHRYQQLQFQLLFAGESVLSEEEACALSTQASARCWRRVILFGEPYFDAVFSILVMPESGLKLSGQTITHYGSEPIGHLLFNGPEKLIRRDLSYAELPSAHPNVKLAEHYVVPSLPSLLARQSICCYKGAPLLITDTLLPDLIHDIEQS